MSITQDFINQFNQYAYDTANSFGGLTANPDPLQQPTHNDQYDAYRHALLSAELTRISETLSREMMDDHENSTLNNPPLENNMDRWNNNVGREEYKKWSDAVDAGQTSDSLEKWIYDRVKEGKTINDLTDTRTWNEPPSNLDKIKDVVSTAFAAASIYVTPVRLDPLVLDLDGDGIETLPINTTTPVMFDLNNSGVKKSVGWIKADDGFLVLDRNGNGTIDTGAELFGDATPLSGGGTATDGFAALAQLDTNLDGQMTASDSAFANLRVWRDLNQNGLSEAGELSTLAALNIISINVAASSHVITVSNGNLITDQGSYTRGDGTVGSVGETANSADVQLATDPFHTTFTTPLTLTAQALTLPDMNGSGQVRNLREAISSNSALATLVTQFTQATTSADRRALLDNILKEWSNTSTMSTTFTGAYTRPHTDGERPRHHIRHHRIPSLGRQAHHP